MCAERLHFSPGQMDYDALLAAEHVSRYVFATQFCAGKRVLDVACGEGYGSLILATEGAAGVVGVDNSAEALGVARDRFAHDRVEYLEGDALTLMRLLAGKAPFDVIVSFETIEHIADIRQFLGEIKGVLASDGIILVSCPNDELEVRRGISNPYHIRTYTLAEFQQATMAVLGEADHWYLGTPLQGIMIADAELNALCNTRTDLGLMVEARETVAGQLLPAQSNMNVAAGTCSFYLGLWGAAGIGVHVASPISRQALLEPWLALDYFKAERSSVQEQIAFLEQQIGELRRAATIERSGVRKQVRDLQISLRDTQARLFEIEPQWERTTIRLREIEPQWQHTATRLGK